MDYIFLWTKSRYMFRVIIAKVAQYIYSYKSSTKVDNQSSQINDISVAAPFFVKMLYVYFILWRQ